MDGKVFVPNIRSGQDHEEKENEQVKEKHDGTGNALVRVAQYAIMLLVGLIPVFFTPGLYASLGFDKTLLTISLSSVALISLSLLMLRRRRAKTVLPLSLGLFWGVVLIALVSGLLSGDAQDALRGSVMETQTVAFLGVMALLMSVMLVMQTSKIMTIKTLTFFAFTSGLVMVYALIRVLFGASVLPFGSFGAVTVSPVGGFNDLALLAGLTIILSLITLVQLPLRAAFQYAIAALTMIALVLLMVVNFFNIWIVVGFFGLLLFIYLLSRDTLFRSNENVKREPQSKVLIVVTMFVCIASAVFIVAGDYAGGKISQMTGVNYVEVRPSFESMVGISRAVYQDSALLGNGPNRFADAWRMHKDPSINETIFWDTDFNAGSGFIPTLFVNLGLLGGLLILAAHLAFLYLGYRMLLRSSQTDSYWNYFGVLSFAAAVFLWGMSYVYVPGAAMLLLAAVFTGFTYVAAGSLLPTMVRTIPLAVNRRRGFFLMAGVIFVITVCVGTLFSVGEQYVAQARFTEAQITAETVEEFEVAALNAFQLYSDDRFVSARAQIQLANLNALMNVAEPTEEQQQRFVNALQQGVGFADVAVAEDATNPDHHAILASIFGNLAATGNEEAKQRAEASLAEAQRLDPLNPGYRLLAAQMAVRLGDIEKARSEIGEALNLKRNYTEALYLSAQLDISEGDVESAIATTRAMITLEPNNATRYFQLGLLLSAAEDIPQSVAAFQAAIAIDSQYANARYMLALAYLNLDERDAALEQLRIVQESNADNESLNTFIEQIESGETFDTPDLGLETPVAEVAPEQESEDVVTTEADVDTDLVTPVNTIGDTEAVVEPEAPDIETPVAEEAEGEDATETEPAE